MGPSSRKRWFGATMETMLFISVVVGIVLGVVLVGRPQGTPGVTGGAAEVGLLQETAAPSDVVVPTSPLPDASISQPQPSPSVQRPEDPFGVVVCARRIDDINFVADQAPMIVRGVVKQVQPVRWSTPDGKRPPNPHAPDRAGNTIYRPVIVQVDEYLKGDQPPRVVLVVGLGGTIGKDSIDYCGDTTFTFVEGEQVVLFLKPADRTKGPTAPATPGGPPVFDVVDHYTITDDGQARSSIQQLPVQGLLDQIQASVVDTPVTQP